MKVYILEQENNKEWHEYLKGKNMWCGNLLLADVVIVNRVENIRRGLDIVDSMLMLGKEVICIKNKFGREYYVCNHLIKEGAMYV